MKKRPLKPVLFATQPTKYESPGLVSVHTRWCNAPPLRTQSLRLNALNIENIVNDSEMQAFPTWNVRASATCVSYRSVSFKFKLQSPSDHIAITVDPSINRWMDLVYVHFPFFRMRRTNEEIKTVPVHTCAFNCMQTVPLQLHSEYRWWIRRISFQLNRWTI